MQRVIKNIDYTQKMKKERIKFTLKVTKAKKALDRKEKKGYNNGK